MPRIHDPDLVIARARLDSAHTLLRGAMAKIYKDGAVDRSIWSSIVADLDAAKVALKHRVKPA